tara:strand:- start:412 stop:1134 length:723 start_codon:yes stop_codon:yes gene_type:complete
LLRVKLTKRDIHLLYDLYSNVFLSFEQIRREHFKNCATSTVYNRLSKLIKAHLIVSRNINLSANNLLAKDVGVIYFVTQIGLKKLKVSWHGEIFRNFPAPINLNNVFHDLLLTDILRELKRKFSYSVSNTKIMDLSKLNLDQIPDALVIDKKSNSNLAIELELTAKSKQRYREIISNYATNNLFDRVIYLVKDDGIIKKIGGIITGSGNHFEASEDTGKFEFINIKNLLKVQKSEVCSEL